jgi:hypothetical protein
LPFELAGDVEMNRHPRRIRLLACAFAFGLLAFSPALIVAQSKRTSYLGFDRNLYPGNQHLAALRKTFAFAGYWLNPPPGETQNSWAGKRRALRAAGFGFLVLFNGRLDTELKKAPDAALLGRSDAGAAVEAARREGFPPGTIIFLDQEEGGGMLREQKSYIYAWIDGVAEVGYRAGIYCSGIPAPEDSGATVITANDIRQSAGSRHIAFWVVNDACPPSPGCSFPRQPPVPTRSGVTFAEIWQYAQSPKRKDVAGRCPANHDRDGNCYPPGLVEEKILVDVDAATAPDPSNGR